MSGLTQTICIGTWYMVRYEACDLPGDSIVWE